MNGCNILGYLTVLASGSLKFDGGNVDGHVTVNSGGQFDCANAQVGSADGWLTIGPGGVMNLGGNMGLGAPLTNYGTVNWQAGHIMVYSNITYNWHGEIWNLAGALWDCQCSESMTGWSAYQERFHNLGQFRKSGGTNTTTMNVHLENGGIVLAQSGTLRFFANYTDSSASTLGVSLGGTTFGSDYGHIQFDNPLTTFGSFAVNLRNGFLPTPGDTFTVLSYPSATSAFGCFTGLDLGGGLLLQPQVTATSLKLAATTYATNSAAPQLLISAAPGVVFLTWPLGYPDWGLQSTTNLSNPAWSPLALQCTSQAVVPMDSPQRYFRLIKN